MTMIGHEQNPSGNIQDKNQLNSRAKQLGAIARVLDALPQSMVRRFGSTNYGLFEVGCKS